MVNIYILKLEGGKYYVGKTNNISTRIEDHFSHRGSKWTMKYKPISVLSVKEGCDDYDEDKITQQCMDEYGVNNVRGGTYTTIVLSENDLKSIEKRKKGTNDLCYKCGKKGHFVNTCPIKAKKDHCNRCGRNNHPTSNCYAKTTLKGDIIGKKSDTCIII